MTTSAENLKGMPRIVDEMIQDDLKAGYTVEYVDPKADPQLRQKLVEIARKCGRSDDFIRVEP
jgi:predicted RNA-binding protein with PUA-like domain